MKIVFFLLLLTHAASGEEMFLLEAGEEERWSIEIPQVAQGKLPVLELIAYSPGERFSGWVSSLRVTFDGVELCEVIGRTATFGIIDGRRIPTYRQGAGWAIPVAENAAALEAALSHPYAPTAGPDLYRYRFPLRFTPGSQGELQLIAGEQGVALEGCRVTVVDEDPSTTPPLPRGATVVERGIIELAPQEGREWEVVLPPEGEMPVLHLSAWRSHPQPAGSAPGFRIYWDDLEMVGIDTDTPERYQSGKGWRVPLAPGPEAFRRSYASPRFHADPEGKAFAWTFTLPTGARNGFLRVESTLQEDGAKVVLRDIFFIPREKP